MKKVKEQFENITGGMRKKTSTPVVHYHCNNCNKDFTINMIICDTSIHCIHCNGTNVTHTKTEIK